MSKNTSLKRIRADLRELSNSKSLMYTAAPSEQNMYDWHFTIRGPPDSPFWGGLYHGRILLPPDYPFKPPHIIFLTENGRFAVGQKICLSMTGYHPEYWQPCWGIRLILEVSSWICVAQHQHQVRETTRNETEANNGNIN